MHIQIIALVLLYIIRNKAALESTIKLNKDLGYSIFFFDYLKKHTFVSKMSKSKENKTSNEQLERREDSFLRWYL